MKCVPTQDGTLTWYCDDYREHYHSLGGAYLEAYRIYVKGCDLLEKARTCDEISILDIGFGLGYNVFVAIENILAVRSWCKINVVSFEMDRSVLEFNQYPASLHFWANRIKKHWLIQDDGVSFQDGQVDLKIYLQDARSKIESLQKRFDAVFHDPFSHPKNPELWTVEFFSSLAKLTKPDGKLATYSMATPVLNAMDEAGWFPVLARGTGTKKYSVVATLEKEGGLSPHMLEKLVRSTEKIPYRDLGLKQSRQSILKIRQEACSKLKSNHSCTPSETRYEEGRYEFI
ncbi:MAG: hypothetical protein HY390_00345 [Deltaproteobacteria bacterium]|nr:hypothetical protein [Deltaproteobacteria bacterium]